MTYAEALEKKGEQKGRQEGEQKGRQEERMEIAKKLIRAGMHRNEVARLIDLSPDSF